MKYNLKNRPHLHWKKTLQEIGYSPVSEVEKWFEGFESELRKKLVHPTNTKSIAVYDFIKEILGEKLEKENP